MQLNINGDNQEMEVSTIGQVLVRLGLDKTACDVELNRTLMRRGSNRSILSRMATPSKS